MDTRCICILFPDTLMSPKINSYWADTTKSNYSRNQMSFDIGLMPATLDIESFYCVLFSIGVHKYAH